MKLMIIILSNFSLPLGEVVDLRLSAQNGCMDFLTGVEILVPLDGSTAFLNPDIFKSFRLLY